MKAETGIKIYHNSACSKSCEALELLKKMGESPKVVSYIEDTPNRDELIKILKLLKLKPRELIRTKEPLFRQHYEGLVLSDEEWLDILLANPILIERPIIIKDDKAVIGRPVEKIIDIL